MKAARIFSLAMSIAFVAGCTTPYPWQEDALEKENVKKLKAATPGPMKYAAAVALRKDPASWQAGPADAFKAIANSVQPASQSLSGAAEALGKMGEISREGPGTALPGLKAAVAALANLEAALDAPDTSAALKETLKKASDFLASASQTMDKAVAETAKIESLTLEQLTAVNNKLDDAGTAIDDAGSVLADAIAAGGSDAALAGLLKSAADQAAAALQPLMEASAALQSKQGPKFAELSAKVKDALKIAGESLAKTAPKPVDHKAAVRAAGEAANRALSSIRTYTGKDHARAAEVKAAMKALADAFAKGPGKKDTVSAASKPLAALLADVEALASSKAGPPGSAEAAGKVAECAAALKALSLRAGSAVSKKEFTAESAINALTGLCTALETACKAVDDAAKALGSGDAAAAGQCSDSLSAAASSLANVAAPLAAAQEEVASSADPSMSFDPDAETFRKGFCEVFGKFGLFGSLEEMDVAPAAQGRDAYIAEARRKGIDFLVLLEPTRNDVNYLGFNSNHWYSLLIWSFAWLASNFVPDEKWESHVEMKVSVIDVRSGQDLYVKDVDSRVDLNLADNQDGFHLFGIVFGNCDPDNLKDAAEYVLPYHLTKIKADLIENFEVSFRNFTGTEEFVKRRDMAPPEGFALCVGVSNYLDDSFNVLRKEAQASCEEAAKSVEATGAALAKIAQSLGSLKESPESKAASEASDALSKAAKFASLAAEEIQKQDAPTSVSSMNKAIEALKQACEKLKAVPVSGPAIEKKISGPKGLIEMLTAILDKAKGFKKAEGFKSLVLRQEGILKNTRELPNDIKKVRVELSGKEGAEKEIDKALAAVSDVDAVLASAAERFKESDLDGGCKAQTAALGKFSEARAALDPLKALSATMNAVLGKIDWLISEQKTALDEAGKAKADPAQAVAIADLGKAGAAIEAVRAEVSGDVKKAGDALGEMNRMSGAIEKNRAAAAEIVKLLADAAAKLKAGRRVEAVEPMKAAARMIEGLAGELKPLVEGKRTLVGSVLEVMGQIEALSIEAAQSLEGERGASAKAEGMGIGRALREHATVIEGYAATLKEIRRVQSPKLAAKPAADLAACAGSMTAAAGSHKTAAERFENDDIPGGLKKTAELVDALGKLRTEVEAVAKVVPDAGSVVFALDQSVEQIRAYQRLAEKSAERAVEAYKALGDAQAGFATIAVKIEAAVSEIEKSDKYASSKPRVPDVFKALAQARIEVNKAAAQLIAGANAFKKGEGLVGRQEVKNSVDRLVKAHAAMIESVKGKESAVELIQAAVNSLVRDRLMLAEAAKKASQEAAQLGVDFASKDAETVAGILSGGLGFHGAYVKLLKDADATLDNLRNAFDEAACNRVLSKDLFVFYFAGSGAIRKAEFAKSAEIAALALDLSRLAQDLEKLKAALAAAPPSQDLVKAAAAQSALADSLKKAGEAVGAAQRKLEAASRTGMGDAISGFLKEIESIREAAPKAAGLAGSDAFAPAVTALKGKWAPLAAMMAADLPAVPSEKEIAASIDGALKAVKGVSGEMSGLVAGIAKDLPGKAEKDAAQKLAQTAAALAKKASTLPAGFKTAAEKAAGIIEKLAPEADAAGAALGRGNLRAAVNALEKAVDPAKADGLPSALKALADVKDAAAEKKDLEAMLGTLKADLQKARDLSIDPAGKGSGAAWDKKLEVIAQTAIKVNALVTEIDKGIKLFEKSRNAAPLAAFKAERAAVEQAARGLAAIRESLQSEKNWGDAQAAADKCASEIEALGKRLAAATAAASKLALAVAGLADATKKLETAATESAKAGKAGHKAAVDAINSFNTAAGDMHKKLGEAASDLLAQQKAGGEAMVALVAQAAEAGKTAEKAAEAAKLMLDGRGPAAAAAAEEAAAAAAKSAEALAALKGKCEEAADLAAMVGKLAESQKKIAADAKAAKPSQKLADAGKAWAAALEKLKTASGAAKGIAGAVAAFVPEPAKSAAMADRDLGTAVAALDAAGKAMAENDLVAARESAAKALELVAVPAAALAKLKDVMKDLFGKYLLLHDSAPGSEDIKAISLFEVASLIEKLGARRAVVVLDTSFAPSKGPRSRGVLGKGVPPAAPDNGHLEDAARGAEWCACGAASPEQFALEDPSGKGLFTMVFADGLTGKADTDGDGRVSWAELSAFVQAAVSNKTAAGAPQAPVFMGPGTTDAFGFKTKAKEAPAGPGGK